MNAAWAPIGLRRPRGQLSLKSGNSWFAAGYWSSREYCGTLSLTGQESGSRMVKTRTVLPPSLRALRPGLTRPAPTPFAGVGRRALKVVCRGNGRGDFVPLPLLARIDARSQQRLGFVPLGAGILQAQLRV